MTKKPKVEHMWAIKFPDGSLTTVRITRGQTLSDWADLTLSPWGKSVKRGFRCVRVEVREVEK